MADSFCLLWQIPAAFTRAAHRLGGATSRCFGLQVSLTSCQVFSCPVPGCLQLLPNDTLQGSPALRRWQLDQTQTGARVVQFDWLEPPSIKARAEFAVRRQVKLALSEKKGARENSLRLNFPESFGTFLCEFINRGELLAAGTDTLQDEEPQVSIEKARSYHHSKLNPVVLYVLTKFR